MNIWKPDAPVMTVHNKTIMAINPVNITVTIPPNSEGRIWDNSFPLQRLPIFFQDYGLVYVNKSDLIIGTWHCGMSKLFLKDVSNE